MNLHEYIQKLLAIEDVHGGDLRVVDTYDEEVSAPEFGDDFDNGGAVIICDKS